MASVDSTGVVTVLFTGIEGSTRLWEQEPDRMSVALTSHDALIRAAVDGNRGVVVKMVGDGLYAVFGDPLDAVKAALAMQTALGDAGATNGVALRVRCGVHAGAVERRDNDFFGGPVNRAARIMDAAHGGQVLLSKVIVDLAADRLPAEASVRDLGSVRLRDLASAEHLYQLVHPRLRQDFPPLRSLETTPNNLPQQMTSFVGRDEDIARVRRLLVTARLLTLLGPGGIGKTRLSLQCAADMIDAFRDGAWVVELASLPDDGLVPQMVAQALGVREEFGVPLMTRLAAADRPRQLVLILDNCEHLVAVCAEIAAKLLRSAPDLRIVVTSREPLRIEGEHHYSLLPLALPDSTPRLGPAAATSSPAVELFVDRARQQQPSFKLDDRNVANVVEICRRLDGIPLALELAAARVRTLTVAEVAKRLDDRFRLLTGGARTALQRQQTLRATIDWSYDLLSGDERIVFARLAVFAGSWTIAAAERVCAGDPIPEAAVMDLLAGLTDKSLVVCDSNDSTHRYSMLETIREYAAEKLAGAADHDTTRDRHLDFYLALADTARGKLTRGTFTEGMEELERDRENLLAALTWCNSSDERASRGLRLVFDLQGYWDQRAQYGTGLRLATLALNQAGACAPTLERGQALLAASHLAYRMGQYAEARDRAEEGVAILRNQGPRALFADALIRLAHPLVELGDIPTAQRHIEERLALVRAIGDERRIASTVNGLAELHRLNNKLDLAVPLYEEALALARLKCDPPTLAVCQLNIALVSVVRGDTARAHAMLQEALSLVEDPAFKHVVGIALDVAFALAAESGEWTVGARLLGASEAQQAEMRHSREAADAASVAPFAARTREALGEAAFSAAYAAGRDLSYDAALAETLAWLRRREA
jgi:predicted ATPase/class 3 adenylate cyclase